ncbi:MAG: hypothetical protein CME62_00885 [Halobacteriovoraceae bacterium]|nr:hypothetical protein [Halobacteriovoraceae bacterium]
MEYMNNIVSGLKDCIRSEFGIENKGDFRKEVGLFEKRIWRVSDVARFLDCSQGHIYNLCSDEKIPKRKKGKFLYFVPSEILEWILKGDVYDN